MRKLLCLLAGAVFLLAACGDDGGKTTAAGGGSGSAPVALTGKVNAKGNGDGTSGTVDVSLDDFSFTPTYIQVKAGAQLTVKLTNNGKTDHTFTIDSLNVNKQLAPGKSDSVTFTTESSGAVQFLCTFHSGSGMKGALYINSGDSLAAGAGGGDTNSSSSSNTTTTAGGGGGGYGY